MRGGEGNPLRNFGCLLFLLVSTYLIEIRKKQQSQLHRGPEATLLLVLIRATSAAAAVAVLCRVNKTTGIS